MNNVPMDAIHLVLCTVISLIVSTTGVEGILCYQCNSTDLVEPYQCRETLGSDVDIEAMPCDAVYNAAYCIKHTGRFEGPYVVGGVDAILCYQCLAPNNTDCSDLLIHDTRDSSLVPSSCEHVFEASYCIKATGVHGGGIGTQRYCSSVDMGNYCNYIRLPGDAREYRSCVYTCDTDGCNSSPRILSWHHLPLVLLISVLLL